MEDDHGQHLEEGWQANDLRTGVAKVYADAKRRNQTGKYVAAAWSAFMLVYAALNVVGIVAVTPPAWDFAAGIAVVFLALLGYSSGPLLAASAIMLIDLGMVAYNLPGMREHGDTNEYMATALRVIVGPAALSFTLSGYLGALSIEAFKRGFSPGQDWRTRINPLMLQAAVFGSCAVALIVGVTTWFGAISAGFARTDVEWKSKDSLLPDVEMDVARPKVEEAKIDRRSPKHFLNIKVLTGEGEKIEDATEYPEAARPIETLDGLDAFSKHEIEDAFWFAEDTDEQGCEREAQGKQDRCRDDRCKHWARIFLRACLAKSRKTEHYCDGVPHPMKTEPGLIWAEARCVGRQFETCRELLFAVQGHCHPPGEVGEVAAKAAKSGDSAAGKASGKAPANTEQKSASPGEREKAEAGR